MRLARKATPERSPIDQGEATSAWILSEQHPRLCDLLRGKAAASCRPGADRARRSRLAPGQGARRGGGARGSAARAHQHRAALLGELRECEGIELHLHATPLYNSLFRFDEEMFVTPHLYGVPGYGAPLLHLRRLGAEGLFTSYAKHFDDVWATSIPAGGSR